MLMDDVPEFMIDDGADLFNGMLGDKSVEEYHFAEVPEAGNERV